jgi:hypothetical protein
MMYEQMSIVEEIRSAYYARTVDGNESFINNRYGLTADISFIEEWERKMKKHYFTCQLMLCSLVFLTGMNSYSQNIIIKPAEIQDVLINPGMGFTTFHRFNSDHIHPGESWSAETVDELLQPDGNLEYVEYPPTSIAYFRWYWDEIEPEQGKYNWQLIDETIEQAQQNQQKLAFRIMPQNGVPKAPEWYRKIAPGFKYENGRSWMPDYESPLFREHYGRLVTALAERYDGHPDIDHIDLGIVGRWGEWHTSETGNPMPSMETQISFVDLYLQTFQKSLILMLIGGDEALAYAIRNGAGWRADCLGDMGGFNKIWNHMEDMYPIALAKANGQDTWKTAPVVFESCWTMQYWVEQGWDVREILDRALMYHTSVFNNKSSTIPKEYWAEVNDFLRKMGYRFVLRRLQFRDQVKAGSTLEMEVLWENIGVAPTYHPFQLVYQIRDEDSSYDFPSSTDIRSWLPGYHLTEEEIQLPDSLQPGEYTLRVGILDPNTKQPAVRLAIEGREEDGWYTLGRFSVRK